MPEELDLEVIERRFAILLKAVFDPHNGSRFDQKTLADHGQMIEEIYRLRALVATEQAKTAHARDWCEWWITQCTEMVGVADIPAQASDGWDGGWGGFVEEIETAGGVMTAKVTS